MSQRTLHHSRERRIQIIKRRLLLRSTPRLHVSGILLIAGLSGFLTSASLLHLGVFNMWLRYPIAILIAYGVFLLCLRLWLWAQGRRFNFNPDSQALDFVEPDALDLLDPGGSGYVRSAAGKSLGHTVASHGGGGFEGIGVDFDFEELWLVVIALIAIAAGLMASLYVVFIAPTLLAEILVDGVLMAGLYRRLVRIEHRHWLHTAFRKTVLPALLAAVFFGVAGYALQTAVPEAHSIGQVWKQIK